MEEKRPLIVNVSLCDTRRVREETLASYSEIVINSSAILVDQQSRALLDSYPVVLNGNIIEADGEVRLSKFEGKMEIGPAQAAGPGKIFLKGNGKLNILPGSGEALEHYLRIKVKGAVTCPESLAGSLSMLDLSGSLHVYPDGAVLLKSTTVLDRTFHLRAREDACYFAARRVVALAPDIDFTRLAEKKARFVTRELLVAEGLAEAALPLFDEKVEITILPDGCAYLSDDVTLDENLLRRRGGKLYVEGNLTIPGESAHLLPQLTFLTVKGDIRLPQDLIPALQELEEVQYGELKPTVGILIEDRLDLTVDRELLENAPDGLTIVDCVNVKFKKDVPPQLIRERLRRITDCVNVSCTEEQQSAIELVAQEVVRLGPGRGSLMGEIVQSVLGGREDARDVLKARFINGDTYTL